MHSDQRQPGSKLSRPMVKPSSLTTSTLVLAGVLVSSGESCDLVSNLLTATGVAILHLQLRYDPGPRMEASLRYSRSIAAHAKSCGSPTQQTRALGTDL